MNAYKKYLTIDDPNNLVLSGLPFTSGQRVEIIILLDEETTTKESEQETKAISNEEFLIKANRAYTENDKRKDISQRFKQLFDETQAIPEIQDITEEEIAAEIEAYRRGE